MPLAIGTGYALKALAAMPEDGTYLSAGTLAARLGLPGPYLARLLQSLVHQGLLESVRGPNGGFRMAMPAHRLTVGRVAAALDGGEGFSDCLLVPAGCQGPGCPCALAQAIGGFRERVEGTILGASIRDLQVQNLKSRASKLIRENQGFSK